MLESIFSHSLCFCTRSSDLNYLSDLSSFSLCIFCGKKDESFTEDGLDLHYWKHCPMLRRCDECRQVDSWIPTLDLLILAIKWKDPSTLLYVVFTGGRDRESHRASSGWMRQQVQVQPVSALLGGCGHWRPDSARPGCWLQPWVHIFSIFLTIGACVIDVSSGWIWSQPV